MFALRAAVYLAALGPQGLKETAELCLQKAHYAKDQLCQLPGVEQAFDRPFFKEFTLKITDDVPTKLREMLAKGFHAGLALGTWFPEMKSHLSVAVTEKRTRQEIDAFVAAMADGAVTAGTTEALPLEEWEQAWLSCSTMPGDVDRLPEPSLAFAQDTVEAWLFNRRYRCMLEEWVSGIEAEEVLSETILVRLLSAGTGI